MPAVKTLIQQALPAAVQRAWDGWFAPRDEPPGVRTSGAPAGTAGASRRAARNAYLIAGVVVIASTLVDALSKAQEIGWRLATPGNLWEPLLWNCTSGAVILALLPLTRRAAWLARGFGARPVHAGSAIVALGLLFGAVHVALMFPLRQLAYAVAGWDYTIHWTADRVFYELRKDLFAYAVLAVIFWLAERPAAAVPAALADPPPGADLPPNPAELWLRDGRTSILIAPHDIVSVASAGNYVEYALTGGRKHLIRATLQAEEARLVPFGLARVHRTRLVNLKRVIALEWRASGDFELTLDSGETVAGSRRFKDAVGHLGA
jgi:hypothetical protein